jgi:hypothetical protein
MGIVFVETDGALRDAKEMICELCVSRSSRFRSRRRNRIVVLAINASCLSLIHSSKLLPSTEAFASACVGETARCNTFSGKDSPLKKPRPIGSNVTRSNGWQIIRRSCASGSFRAGNRGPSKPLTCQTAARESAAAAKAREITPPVLAGRFMLRERLP